MTKKKKDWVILPSGWIITGRGLKYFRWDRGNGSNAIAALMVLVAIAHHADQSDGTAKMTYDQLEEVTGLSRVKVSNGLEILLSEKIIMREAERSAFRLANFDPKKGWAKIPLKSMYGEGTGIKAFFDFRLRRAAELHAIKIFLLLAAFRNQATNRAKIGYDKIVEYTGIDRVYIKRALTVLAVQGLVYSDSEPSSFGAYGINSAYRLAGIEPNHHNGTTGRREMTEQTANIFD